MSEPLAIGELVIHTVIDFADQEWPAGLLIPDSTPDELLDPVYAPPESYNPETQGLRLQFGGHIVTVEGRTILIDTGVGSGKIREPHPDWNLRGDRTFLDSLEALGYAPEDIDVVVITHAHVDHVGWLTTGSPEEGWTPTFPRAEHVIARPELDHWLAAEASDPSVNFGSTTDSIIPLLNRVTVTRGEEGHEIAPGVTLRLYPGHTPGNAAVWVESGGETAVICGDTIHHPIQLRYPDWSSGFCLDPHNSANGRRRLLDEVVARDAVLIPNHFRLPPTRIARDGDHYRRCED